MEFVTIDFEASCLPSHGRSFPIEVGISGSEGVRSWLIKPDQAADWDWTQEATALHGLTPEQLESAGQSPAVVFAALQQALAGRRVIADSRIDAFWWNRLAGLARTRVPCPIDYVGTVLDALGVSSTAVFAAQVHADTLHPLRHRAAHDALWLRAVLTRLMDGCVSTDVRGLVRTIPFNA